MSINIYNHNEVDAKWQTKWDSDDIYKTSISHGEEEKYYCLDMYPYPSGAGLHVGHVEGYTGTDVVSRYMRMKGYNVLHPMGWDAFGLPAENYAIKTGIHPAVTTQKAIDNFRSQIKNLGMSYDWTREIGTHTPEYYKWTQWLFLKLYENDLAYKTWAKVNWCESCQTVLANEQVVNGRCERCDNLIVKKDLNQWFFRITNYAEELLSGLDSLDWLESTKMGQRNWIGKSKGVTFDIKVEFENGADDMLSIFTTRIDTFTGVTFVVVAPEHEFWARNKNRVTNFQEISDYIDSIKMSNDIDRLSDEKAVTGIKAEGIWYTHPITKEKVPVYVADYVLVNYGTGVVMGVPGHDTRDARFAEKFGLPIVLVIEAEPENDRKGALINSGNLNGLTIDEATGELTKLLNGKNEVKYRLRDWLVSRQRYWGAPIPIVYDPEGNPHMVPEEYLPWLLPDDVDFKPTGIAPLGKSKELVQRTERIFGKGWRPEIDTLDGFVCSSWYYLRFVDPGNDKEFASKKTLEEWLPVDAYVGGAEHTVLHLLYARFVTKVLRDLGYLDFDEPFLKLRHPGMVLAEDRRKMSKRWGNVINPDDVVAKYGADSVRLYEMFMGPFADTIPWSNQGLVGCRRFIDKVWQMAANLEEGEVDSQISWLVDKVSEDIEEYKFNTAIAAMMKWINSQKSKKISKATWQVFLRLLAPFAPHITEELWQALGQKFSIHQSRWPVGEVEAIDQGVFEVPVQIDGKVRFVMQVEAENIDKLEQLALDSPQTLNWVSDLSKLKVIVIPKRLVSLVSQK